MLSETSVFSPMACLYHPLTSYKVNKYSFISLFYPLLLASAANQYLLNSGITNFFTVILCERAQNSCTAYDKQKG